MTSEILVGIGSGNCQFGTKPVPEPMLSYCQSNPRKHILTQFYYKCNDFHSWKYISNVVCNMSAISSRPWCVTSLTCKLQHSHQNNSYPDIHVCISYTHQYTFTALKFVFLLLAPHICVNESGQHWFRQWLVAYLAPSHYLNQCWNIANWTLRNKIHWNLNRNSYIFIQENASENIVCEMASVLSRGDELTHLRWKPATVIRLLFLEITSPSQGPFCKHGFSGLVQERHGVTPFLH